MVCPDFFETDVTLTFSEKVDFCPGYCLQLYGMLHLMSGWSVQKSRVQSACTVDNAPVQEAAQACNNLKTCQAAITQPMCSLHSSFYH